MPVLKRRMHIISEEVRENGNIRVLASAFSGPDNHNIIIKNSTEKGVMDDGIVFRACYGGSCWFLGRRCSGIAHIT